MEQLLVTPREAAKLLAISARKLWALTHSGGIPHLKIGRSVRYSIEELKKWIEASQTGN